MRYLPDTLISTRKIDGRGMKTLRSDRCCGRRSGCSRKRESCFYGSGGGSLWDEVLDMEERGAYGWLTGITSDEVVVEETHDLRKCI